MFEGGFAESSPDGQQISIQDIKMKTFALLLRFMYTGKLSKNLEPSIIYSDDLVDEDDVSIEDLFLAVDRYNVQQLRDQTLSPLLKSLGAEKAIPFLFRTAYKFPQLRKPVIQYVAKSCGSALSRTNMSNVYKDHPDALDIVMDLLEVYNDVQS